MEFSMVDCMFVFHDMDYLNKQLKIKFNITCEIINNEPEIKIEEVKVPEVKTTRVVEHFFHFFHDTTS